MKWGESVREYFSFNMRDRIAVLVLALLVLIIGIAPKLIPPGTTKLSDLSIDTTWLTSIKSPTEESTDNEHSNSYTQLLADRTAKGRKIIERTLFYFDPNTLDASGWKKLGLRDKTISTIQKYLSSGGAFL